MRFDECDFPSLRTNITSSSGEVTTNVSPINMNLIYFANLFLTTSLSFYSNKHFQALNRLTDFKGPSKQLIILKLAAAYSSPDILQSVPPGEGIISKHCWVSSQGFLAVLYQP